MNDAVTLQAKADRAAGRSERAAYLSGTGALYGMLSLPDGHQSSSPKTPYDYTLGWAVDMVSTANHIGSFFLENVLSIKIPANVLGAAVGFGIALVSGAYSRVQHRKMKAFQAQADELLSQKTPLFNRSNGLKI